MARFMNFLFGSNAKQKQLPTYTPQQQAVQNLLLGPAQGQQGIPGSDYLTQLLGGGPEAFAQYEAPALRQFQQEILPGIAERFSGMGMGARGSSAFNQQLAQAGERLTQDLAGQRANLRSGALQQLLGMTQAGMQPSFGTMTTPAQYGFLPQLLGQLGQGYGAGLGLRGFGF